MTVIKPSEPRRPWNKGLLVGQKRPLVAREVWAIRVRLEMAGNARELALFNLAIDSKLRACDLLALTVEDVCVGGRAKDRATVIQRKTRRPVHFEISAQARASLEAWLRQRPVSASRYLFPSSVDPSRHLSTRQYARIVHRWIGSIGLDTSAYGTHTMRRTKASAIYRATSNIRAVQLLLGHAKLESTVRYLGIEIEDALSIAERIEL